MKLFAKHSSPAKNSFPRNFCPSEKGRKRSLGIGIVCQAIIHFIIIDESANDSMEWKNSGHHISYLLFFLPSIVSKLEEKA